MKPEITFKNVSMAAAEKKLGAGAVRALRLAELHGIDVTCCQLSRQWICAVEGEVVHVNDLPKLVDAAIAKLNLKEAA